MTTLDPRFETMQVGETRVRVRSTPTLDGEHAGWLAPGSSIIVESDSRTEAGGYIWWKHETGWSTECALDGSEVYLHPLPCTDSAPAISKGVAKAAPALPPAPPTASRLFEVGSARVRVRDRPGLDGASIGWLDPEQIVSVQVDSRTEADGYVWWKHDAGWSAEKASGSGAIFLYEPGSAPYRLVSRQPGVSAPTGIDMMSDGLPNPNTLPFRDRLFQHLPVALEQTLFWQYYGNNVFAYNLWKNGATWYKYAQGLHAGLDFGNSSAKGVPIYAGVSGVFESHRTQAYKPNDLRVQVGPYVIIYGHVANPRVFQKGQPISPDTVMGEIEIGYANAAEHLHLEVRLEGKWIVNPLLLMPTEMRQAIVEKFPPSPRYFYQDGGWNKWLTPLDQPVITLAGSLIGPHA